MKLPVGGEVVQVMRKYERVVFEQDFTLPNGKVENFFLFAATSVPAIVFPVTSDNKVLAIRQFRYAANKALIEVPGGNRKPDQTFLDCLREELVEETGYSPGEIIALGEELWFDPASWRAHYVAFLAKDCRWVQKPKPDSTEMIEVVEIDLDHWLKQIWRGEIRDSKSIVVTFLSLPHLGIKLTY